MQKVDLMRAIDPSSSLFGTEKTFAIKEEPAADKYLIARFTENWETKPDSISSINKQLVANEDIAYISPVFQNGDNDDICALTLEIIVKFKQDNSLEDLKINDEEEIDKIEEIPYGNGAYLITLKDKSNSSPLDFANELYQLGIFEYATPSFFRMVQLPQYQPDDILYNTQWNIPDTLVNYAWDITFGQGTRIAVIDTAMLTTHPDLVPNIVTGYDPTGMPIGFDTHGTQVAGVAAACGNNSIGIAGVAFQAKIIPIRVGYTPSAGTNMLVTNDTWVVDCFNRSWNEFNADVINFSVGLGTPSSAVTNAIELATTAGRGGLGTVVCAATGNSFSNTVGYPANLSFVIGVGAATKTGHKADFSNYGNGIDFAAPGIDIVTTDVNGYTDFLPIAGTSFASPLVSGLAAMIISAVPHMTRHNLWWRLRETTRRIGGYNYDSNGWSQELGYGIVDALLSLRKSIDFGYRIEGKNYLCDGETETYQVPGFNNVMWSAINGMTINSSTGAAIAQTSGYGNMAVINAAINNGIITVNRQRDIPVGPFQSGLFAQSYSATGEFTWAHPYGVLRIREFSYSPDNRIDFGYAPAAGYELTPSPDPFTLPWVVYGVQQIEIISQPSGWLYVNNSVHSIAVACQDPQGELRLNILTTCGWIMDVRFLIVSG